MSRLDQLKLEVAKARSQGDSQPKELDLAIYLLRAGEFRAATEIYSSFKRPDIFNSKHDLAIRVMVFEGLRSYFENQEYDFAVDRLNRALNISIALRQMPMVAMAGAWLGHLTFNTRNYDKMVWAIGAASKALDRHDLDSAVRISLTLADAYCAIEDYERSRDWYQKVRVLAVDCGDQISLAAMMHNRSVISISNLFLSNFLTGSRSEKFELVLSEVASAEFYEGYVGIRPVLYPYLMWKYRISILKGDFSSALKVANSLLDQGDSSGNGPHTKLVLVDCSYCFYKIGDVDLAHSIICQLSMSDFEGFGFDDRAVVFSMMSSIYGACGNVEKRREYERLASVAAENHLIEQSRLRAAIDRLSVDAEFLDCQLFH